jgi:hypothetical protein
MHMHMHKHIDCKLVPLYHSFGSGKYFIRIRIRGFIILNHGSDRILTGHFCGHWKKGGKSWNISNIELLSEISLYLWWIVRIRIWNRIQIREAIGLRIQRIQIHNNESPSIIFPLLFIGKVISPVYLVCPCSFMPLSKLWGPWLMAQLVY